MNTENIRKLEETRSEIISFTNELDEKLRTKEIEGIEYHIIVNERLDGKTKEEVINQIDQEIQQEKDELQSKEGGKKKKIMITLSAAAIIIILMAIIGIIYDTPEAITGYMPATRETQEVIDYNRVFDHYTETQLNLTNITSLRISGTLEGTGAKIKLRINDTEYVVADITPLEIMPETTDPCSNPDINQRPAYCFVGMEDKIFQDLSAVIENRKGGSAGRFTRFGNLIIRGLVIQNATREPGDDDFRVGYTEIRDFEETRTYTVWIDQETGNLYLKGRLYEEEDVLTPPQFNTYIIRNKFGIVLGYFNELRGDLYLKGNLVQLGKI